MTKPDALNPGSMSYDMITKLHDPHMQYPKLNTLNLGVSQKPEPFGILEVRKGFGGSSADSLNYFWEKIPEAQEFLGFQLQVDMLHGLTPFQSASATLIYDQIHTFLLVPYVNLGVKSRTSNTSRGWSGCCSKSTASMSMTRSRF